MAAYLIPHRSVQATPARVSPDTTEAAPRLVESTLTLDPERSIYLFPNPSSIPPSPSGSSLYSVPTDFTTSSPSGSRERTLSHTTDASGLSYVLNRSEYPSREPSRSVSSSHFEADVEVWDWTADSEEVDEERIAELEAAVEHHMSRWDVRHPRSEAVRFVPSVLGSTIGRPPLARAHVFDPVGEGYQRARTDSNISYKSLSSYHPSSFGDPPHPRIRVPLLSFFAYWLGLDLDDPALRLLTTSSSDSVLFPGQGGLLGVESADGTQTTILQVEPSDSDEGSSEGEPSHGILKFFLLSNEPRNALQCLKNGLRMISSPVCSVPTMLTVPNVTKFLRLPSVVESIVKVGGEAIHQLQE